MSVEKQWFNIYSNYFLWIPCPIPSNLNIMSISFSCIIHMCVIMLELLKSIKLHLFISTAHYYYDTYCWRWLHFSRKWSFYLTDPFPHQCSHQQYVRLNANSNGTRRAKCVSMYQKNLKPKVIYVFLKFHNVCYKSITQEHKCIWVKIRANTFWCVCFITRQNKLKMCFSGKQNLKHVESVHQYYEMKKQRCLEMYKCGH